MAQRQLSVHRVAVVPSIAGAAEISGLFQLSDDVLHRPLGDPNLHGHVSHPGGRVLCNAEKHVGVVGEEGPSGG